jgi:hypothetical protein
MKKDVQSREKNGGSRPEKCFLSAQKCFSNIDQIFGLFAAVYGHPLQRENIYFVNVNIV